MIAAGIYIYTMDRNADARAGLERLLTLWRRGDAELIFVL